MKKNIFPLKKMGKKAKLKLKYKLYFAILQQKCIAIFHIGKIVVPTFLFAFIVLNFSTLQTVFFPEKSPKQQYLAQIENRISTAQLLDLQEKMKKNRN
ncbi:hypothetical protein KGV52_00670 [Candidatus Gracilibacteria bacterium]|nr:hypothetical protein [Candidatus Gracilibacteria bacterium]